MVWQQVLDIPFSKKKDLTLIRTRPDMQQESHVPLGKGRNAKITHNLKSDGPQEGPTKGQKDRHGVV